VLNNDFGPRRDEFRPHLAAADGEEERVLAGAHVDRDLHVAGAVGVADARARR